MDPTLLINDIVEHDTSTKKPVEFNDLPISSTGFPQHKRRWKTSAFKQKRAEAAGATAPAEQPQTGKPPQASSSDADFKAVERQRIDQENQQKIANMTPAEIAQAQEDIMNGLNPALIQRLLSRANIEEQSGPSPFDAPKQEKPEETQDPPPTIKVEDAAENEALESTPATAPHAHKASIESASQSRPSVYQAPSSEKVSDHYDEDKAPAQIPPDLFPITDQPKSVHFPVPPALADLDPSDPNFLESLHKKYFPNLPADPSKLAWMAPIPTEDSPADKDSSYYPHPEIAVNALRFDFQGRFLSPRVSRSIPSSKEVLSLRNDVWLSKHWGRILYRLGLGEWGKSEDDPIAMGIWAAVKKGRVLDSLTEAAMTEGGHRGSRVYATEALWLFEKGGWKEKFKGR
ncbi:RNA polymerase II-associated protein 1, N-terminal [Fusarium oxysporum f. sp. vasinfectum]|nr:RNA polymerase II-associated protein 1, N-terminal [Fusarium oxysporum f. sp. vasinfectum]